MTYIERFARLVVELEITIKQRKTNESLRFGYGGVGYDTDDRTKRMVLIERIADDYVRAHADVNQAAIDTWVERGCKGERPASLPLDGALLDRLTDAVLNEEITDPNPYKVSHEDYPFFSDRQLDLRRDRETSLKAAEETGTDGRDYRIPKRRKRTGYENRFVDANAKIRNTERAARYKRDIAPGRIVTHMTEPFVTCVGLGDKWRDVLSLVY
ncbi:hypothetical protein [Cohnella silvisoli]|uniref:Uncharacterized protein n=1 Tax=Cohnella silvisoli TaxID=2873699 RepID=A0ABV1KYX0_9BACL|nr:hypothetical protein [Cohnella silvisoli]MCD9024337.1 hypothetical protein [Cohnella silvisoli]